MSNTYFNATIVCSTDLLASVIFKTYHAFCFYFWQGQTALCAGPSRPFRQFFMAMPPILCFPVIFLSSFLKIGGIPPIGGPNAPLIKGCLTLISGPLPVESARLNVNPVCSSCESLLASLRSRATCDIHRNENDKTLLSNIPFS